MVWSIFDLHFRGFCFLFSVSSRQWMEHCRWQICEHYIPIFFFIATLLILSPFNLWLKLKIRHFILKQKTFYIFHNFDETLSEVSCLDGGNIIVHFESGPLNTRGDAMPGTSQWWHLTDIHHLHHTNADWLLLNFVAKAWESLAVSLPLSHWNTRHQIFCRNASADVWIRTSSGQVFAGLFCVFPCKQRLFFWLVRKAAYASPAATIAVSSRKPQNQKL